MIQVELHSTEPSAVFVTRNTIKMLGGDLVEKDGQYFISEGMRSADLVHRMAVHQGYVRPVPRKISVTLHNHSQWNEITSIELPDRTGLALKALEDAGYTNVNSEGWVREADSYAFVASGELEHIGNDEPKEFWTFSIFKNSYDEPKSLLTRCQYTATIQVPTQDFLNDPKVIIELVELRLLLALFKMVGG